MTGWGEAKRFMEAAFATETNACIYWPYSLSGNGYPQISVIEDGRKRVVRVHRHLCKRRHGPPPPRHDAAHSCGHDRCINKRHLSWKTRKANMADALAHGTVLKGEAQPNSVLKDWQVAEIRSSSLSLRALAAKFGVDFGQVGRIRRGEAW